MAEMLTVNQNYDNNSSKTSNDSFFLSPEQTNGRVVNNKDFRFNIMLTNARSLAPKILSIHTMFREHELDVAMVTESWLKDGKTLDRDVTDLEYGSNMGIIYRNRPKRAASARVVGGGVSIVYDKTKCNLRERKIVGNKFELVLAVGKLGKMPKQCAFFCVYLEPRMKASEVSKVNELIARETLKLKAAGDCLIFIGGDLNRKSITPAVQDFPDIQQVNIAPTRGDACLDILFSNSSFLDHDVWPPLSTDAGILSDHKCVVYRGREENKRDFVWVTKQVRKQTDKACLQFRDELLRTDWNAIMPANSSPDELVDAFEGVITNLVDQLFPLTTVRQRSNEPPWITQGIRRICRKKKRVYKREGKSNLWLALEERSEAMIERSKEQFADTAEQKGAKAYFNAVKNLAKDGAKTDWELQDLFPGKTSAEAGEIAADFFTKISNEYEPLQEQRSLPALRRPVTQQEVIGKLKAAKKPNSMVEGDVPPRLMKLYYREMSVPITTIFNAVFSTGRWPSKWKTETTVVIPKVPSPAGLNECRNISCTPFLSKVLESILLEDIRREIAPDDTQYGGLKQCSVNHLLVDLIDAILAPLDEGNPAVLMGIDFEKAFNRLDHNVCLAELRRLGASSATIDLTRSFLSDRSMRVKVGETLSPNHPLRGGSPQGSILGCLLYCLATQQLNLSLLEHHTEEERQPQQQETADRELSPGGSTDDGEDEGMGLIQEAVPHYDDVEFEQHETTTEVAEVHGGELVTGENPNIFMFKYIDDTTSVETIDKNQVIRHIQARNPQEVVPCPLTNKLINNFNDRAKEIGMVINAKKTQLLVVSADNGYQATASIRVGDDSLESQQGVKLLGFRLGSAPGVHDHVESIKNAFRRKFWSLINLRKAGLKGMKLFKMYAIFVRPIIESNSVIYHSMLGRGQNIEIERMQKLVMFLCFGERFEYEEALSTFNIKTLENRRVEAVKKFMGKALKSRRFADKWFVRRAPAEIDLRTRKPYVEKRARTERYYKSPLLHFQRVANELSI